MKNNKKYLFWGVALLVGFILLIIDSKPKPIPDSNKTTIYVNAPKNMHTAFTETLIDTGIDSEYKIEFTNEVSKANFIVRQGEKEEGELLAYSPIITVFNGSWELYDEYKEKQIFVESQVDEYEYDLDFKKVMDDILLGQNSDIKVYYPDRNSEMWDEFYDFLLLTINDGYYPKDKEMEYAKSRVEAFLDCKNTQPINISGIEKLSGLSKNDIYFMTYADFANLNNYSLQNSYRIMYPKAVVYHNYYAIFDKIGEILYEALDKEQKGLFGSSHIGYINLGSSYYNTKYESGIPGNRFITDNVIGIRGRFNGVEIPKTINSDKEEEE